MLTIKQILSKADPAICGMSEKQITVATKNIDKTITTLRKSGFYVIGKSLDKGSKFQRVWFIRSGNL